MVKVRGVKRYCEFQSLSLTANHKVILIPGQLVKCFRTLLQRVHRSLSFPYKRKTPHKRGLSEHFLSALRLRRLEVSLHNPSRKLHKAMPPAHSLTSALRVNTRRCSPYIIYYTQPKGICQLGSFFFETEVVARYSSLRPEFTTNNEMARCGARHREAYLVLLLLLRCNLQKNTTESLQK